MAANRFTQHAIEPAQFSTDFCEIPPTVRNNSTHVSQENVTKSATAACLTLSSGFPKWSELGLTLV
jgi:hypothetical protein